MPADQTPNHNTKPATPVFSLGGVRLALLLPRDAEGGE
jgi:hypothetical protein